MVWCGKWQWCHIKPISPHKSFFIFTRESNLLDRLAIKMVEIPHQFCTVVKKSLRECKRDFLNDFSHRSYLEGHQSICAKKENGLFYSTFQLEFFSNTIPTRLRLNTSQQGKWCKEAESERESCCLAYPLFSAQTSSIRWIRSVRLACWTHFSTTFEANLCCDNARTLPRTALMIIALSS